MFGGPGPIYPLFGQILTFYIFLHDREWRAVVFEEGRSIQYLLVYHWEGYKWRRRVELWRRGGERRAVEVAPRHAPIVCYYYSLMEWGDMMAVVEGDVEVWVVVYRMDEGWRMVVEYKLP
jgi:hypothetical protein